MTRDTPSGNGGHAVNASEVTVTLAPEELIPSGFDSPVPMVGYLVLAPAGMPIEDLFPLPAPVQERAPEGVTVDTDRRMAMVDGKTLSLTYLEFELLAYFVSNPNRVFTREQLVRALWGYGPVGDQRTVDVHVARLRRKLGPRYRDSIVTVRRVGYKYCPTTPSR
ncbi:winged helix-turn-helix domain-containing protein [Streptomyces sp. 7-21]|jgi:hypothetical protein|uniref:winged helix-turn-helix domain-containing protein n=1 Tax=Streptomyces sp. 7-21 TaxID=2802283 RepID=UPI00191EB930|nr:winged helix-turn-helix domain-containing protein [Streptomyces sp. 7-21]MBL1065245.1 winged helix-turn-helix transcriptional regulator [Streptomyces sp. 7-21]